jgi:hypothetical protein
MKQKLSQLRKDIGNYLYYKLKLKDRKFMAKTAGSIDFGHPVDLDKLEISKDCSWNPNSNESNPSQIPCRCGKKGAKCMKHNPPVPTMKLCPRCGGWYTDIHICINDYEYKKINENI